MKLVQHAVSRHHLCSTVILFSFVAIAALAQDDGEYNDDFAEQQQIAQRRQFQRSGGYDPHSRDFTERCMRLAQFSAEKACDVFNVCCSEDLALNKLNGDRCQDPDPTNGCTLNLQSDGIQWSQCKAYNCTEEITTTTTTTNIPTPSSTTTTPAPILSMIAFVAVAAVLYKQ